MSNSLSRLAAALVAAALVSAAAAAPLQGQFRSAVHVVQLNAAVRSTDDGDGDLVASDFRVTDNGVPQRVIEVLRETVPVDLTIVFDVSARSPGVRTLESILARTKKWMRSTDRLSLVTFSDRISELLSRVQARAVAMPTLAPVDRGAALNDALARVLQEKPVEGRRQVAVVVSRSLDMSSAHTEADVLSLARQSGVVLFAVSPSPVDPSTNAVAKDFMGETPGSPSLVLRNVAEMTGGSAEVLPNSRYSAYSPTVARAHENVDVFTDPLMKALDEFRASYVVTYSPEPATPGWHAVSISLLGKRSNQSVRTRPGYLLE
jgi:hypothetical protein